MTLKPSIFVTMRSAPDTSPTKLVPDLGHRPFASGTRLEDPGACSARSGSSHHANFTAVIGPCPYVQVAERHHARRAAVLGFLHPAPACLRRKVAAVELGNRAHDAEKKHAARGLVDVLGDGDQLCTGLLNREVDLETCAARCRYVLLEDVESCSHRRGGRRTARATADPMPELEPVMNHVLATAASSDHLQWRLADKGSVSVGGW